ncbi:MAG TPA: class I SAM-dependent methyltransferase [Candidatus Acidoferrum sp.]|nr:class I SAM-dependent methyltransferase [Candidatus Acidoferrum sp.]
MRSAEVIVPLVLQLLPVRSVLDVGCGDGTWLAIFQKLGVSDILGIDGHYVQKDLLQIPAECFRAINLATSFRLEREFDLALSLEVAEHIPPEGAAGFVSSLSRTAPAILFSAAIPSQGGDNHLNEQWPDAWASSFRQHGFVPIDCIRKRVWANEAVDWWYAQNILLFARQDLIDRNQQLRAEFEGTYPDQLCLVHPKRYLQLAAPCPPVVNGVISASRLLFTCLKNAVRTRVPSAAKKETRP